jgi:predicted metallopeptidase
MSDLSHEQENASEKTASIKNKRYELSADVGLVAMQVINSTMLTIAPARVKYVKVYPNIAKDKAATCTLASNLVNFFGECDYIVSVSGELWDALNDKLKYILVYHELLHIMPIQNEKTGDWKFALREHDIMEFREIINTYGINWLDELREAFENSGGFEPGEIENISL